MTIRYTPSAAAVSWLALTAALDSRAQMEGDLFKLFGSNTNLVMQETTAQASAAKEAIESQAQQSLAQGLGSIGSGVLSCVVTAVALRGEQANLGKAAALENGIDEEVSLTKLPEDTEELQVMHGDEGAQIEGTSEIVEGGAQIQGNHNESTEGNTTSKKTAQEKDDKEASDPRVKQYERNAQWWMNSANTLANAAGSFATGASSIVQARLAQEQAEAKASEAIAQGLTSIFNAQGGVFTSALASCDTAMQSTNSTINTIVQVSSARA